jgi:hypothetical protein
MDPYEALVLKMYVTNTFLLAQLQFQRARKPRWAKLMELVNGDFLLNYDRYVAELSTIPKMPVMAALSPDVSLADIEALLSVQRQQIESLMAA